MDHHTSPLTAADRRSAGVRPRLLETRRAVQAAPQSQGRADPLCAAGTPPPVPPTRAPVPLGRPRHRDDRRGAVDKGKPAQHGRHGQHVQSEREGHSPRARCGRAPLGGGPLAAGEVRMGRLGFSLRTRFAQGHGDWIF
eukprot:2979590-Prymnesium_polylepis.1